MAHQDEGQRDTNAVVRYALQQRAVCLVAVELRYLHVGCLPLEGLVVQRFHRQLTLHLVQSVGPCAERLVGSRVHLLVSLRHTFVGQWDDSQTG